MFFSPFFMHSISMLALDLTSCAASPTLMRPMKRLARTTPSPGRRTRAAGGRRLQVALLLESSTRWGAGIIEGVCRQVEDRGLDWGLWFEPRGRAERLDLPRDWAPDGVIARITHAPLAYEIVAQGIPAVDVSWYRLGPATILRCSVDEDLAAAAAVEYLTTLGLKQFAYCGSPARPGYSDRFGAAFQGALASRGLPCLDLAWQAAANAPRHIPDPGLVAALAAATKPLGVLAFDGATARRVVEASRNAGVAVPDEVAVLSGEYDDLSSRTSRPAISSLDHSPERIGRRAADLLAALLAGRAKAADSIAFPTAGVVTRQSTDMLAIDDPLVAEAVRMIRSRARDGLQVAEVVRQLKVSRRLLEQRFLKAIGHTPGEEIRRVRLTLARHLLATTSDSLAAIAAASGFEYPETLTRSFRRELGTTPSAYRRGFQGG